MKQPRTQREAAELLDRWDFERDEQIRDLVDTLRARARAGDVDAERALSLFRAARTDHVKRIPRTPRAARELLDAYDQADELARPELELELRRVAALASRGNRHAVRALWLLRFERQRRRL